MCFQDDQEVYEEPARPECGYKAIREDIQVFGTISCRRSWTAFKASGEATAKYMTFTLTFLSGNAFTKHDFDPQRQINLKKKI